MSNLKLNTLHVSIIILFAGVLIFSIVSPVYAHHYRSATMSWEQVDGSERTVLIDLDVNWTLDEGFIPTDAEAGDVFTNKIELNFGDTASSSSAIRVTSVSSSTNDIQTEIVSIKDGDAEYTEGIQHTYSSDGDYVAYWESSTRETTLNRNFSDWRVETRINIGGEYAGNSSPYAAVPLVLPVLSDQVLQYDLIAVDPDGDDVQIRYGTVPEFYGQGDGEANKPTGLEINNDGNITWDVSSVDPGTVIGDLWQMTVMVEDVDSSDNVKSYAPLDFIIHISDSFNEPPVITADQNTYAIDVDDELTFSLSGVDPDWVAGKSSPVFTVVNTPSLDSNIWNVSETSSNGTTTMDVSFTPNVDMDGESINVDFLVRDDFGNADKIRIVLNVSIPIVTSERSGGGKLLAPRSRNIIKNNSNVDEGDEQLKDKLKMIRSDMLRINDIQQIKIALRVFANNFGFFPNRLDYLIGRKDSVIDSVPRDPKFNTDYIYSVTESFERYHLGTSLQIIGDENLLSDVDLNSDDKLFNHEFNASIQKCNNSPSFETISTCYDITDSVR